MKKILFAFIFGFLIIGFLGFVQGVNYPAPLGSYVAGNSFLQGETIIYQPSFNQEDYNRMRASEIKEEMDYENSNLFNICKRDTDSENCTKGPIKFSVYDGERINFNFNNNTYSLHFSILQKNRNGFFDPDKNYSQIIFGSFPIKNLNLSQEYKFNYYMSIKFVGINDADYITNKYVNTNSFVLIISPEYYCQGVWLNNSCYGENSTFSYDGQNYTITNGSMKYAEDSLITNETKNTTINAGITGNAVSEKGNEKSFLQKILNFFGIKI